MNKNINNPKSQNTDFSLFELDKAFETALYFTLKLITASGIDYRYESAPIFLTQTC